MIMSRFFQTKLVVFIGILSLIAACGSEGTNAEKADPVSKTEVGTASEPAPETTSEPEAATASVVALEPSQDIAADDPAVASLPKVLIATSYGPITVALYPDKAPLTVENFLAYVKGRQYTRTIFHRVIPGFMIQGGGFSVYLEQRKTREPVAYEGNNGLSNERGTLAMARTNDPNSATAQWYINHEDNPNLDHGARGPNVAGYTVFGRVLSGLNIVDAIAGVETSTQYSGVGQELRNVPVTPVVIENVTLVE